MSALVPVVDVHSALHSHYVRSAMGYRRMFLMVLQFLSAQNYPRLHFCTDLLVT